MNNPIVPQPQANFMSAFMLGQVDAQSGLLCLPEVYFVRKAEQREYARGHEHIAGSTLLSSQVLGVDYAAEAAEYEEDMLDREYHARGGW